MYKSPTIENLNQIPLQLVQKHQGSRLNAMPAMNEILNEKNVVWINATQQENIDSIYSGLSNEQIGLYVNVTELTLTTTEPHTENVPQNIANTGVMEEPIVLVDSVDSPEAIGGGEAMDEPIVPQVVGGGEVMELDE
jgi:hypothetical protein